MYLCNEINQFKMKIKTRFYHSNPVLLLIPLLLFAGFTFAQNCPDVVVPAATFFKFEVDDLTDITPSTNGDEWTLITDPMAPGGQAFQVPNGDPTFNSPDCCDGNLANGEGSLIQLPVNIPATDTYYILVRGRATGGSNSIWFGLDGSVIGNLDVNNTDANYSYRFADFLGTVQAGAHIVNIWEREDGAFLDQIVISTSPSIGDTIATVQTLEAQVFTIQASCDEAGNINDDAILLLSATNFGDRVGFSTGTTYNGPNYAGADVIGSFPYQLSNTLANPATTQDYTVRVFSSGDDCFVDNTVTLNTQDCAELSCSCTPYLYVNDIGGALIHKFEINTANGALTEIGNPWVNAINRPHGIAPDLNGFLYTASKDPFELFKVNCAGEFVDTVFTRNDYPTLDYNNFVTRGNILYINGRGDFSVEAYDLCTQDSIGVVFLPPDPNGDSNWELYEGPDGRMYTQNQDSDPLIIYEVPFDLSFYNGSTTVLNTIITDATRDFVGGGDFLSSTLCSDGFFYAVLENGDNDPQVVYKIDASTGLKVDSLVTMDLNNAQGIVCSEEAGVLYIASEDGFCVGIIDPVTMTLDVVNSLPGGGGKGIAQQVECCPDNSRAIVEQTFCINPGETVEIFLNEIEECDGVICEGQWTSVMLDESMSFDDCSTSVLSLGVTSGCSTFTKSSDGTGGTVCGAFEITYILCVQVGPACISDYGEFTIIKNSP